MFARRSILTQTFVLLAVSLIVLQAVAIASLFMLPPQRQEGVALFQVVARFHNTHNRNDRRAAELQIIHQARPPVPEPGMIERPLLTQDFAQRMGVAKEDVRLYFRPITAQRDDSRNRTGRRGANSDDGITRMRGEPYFFSRSIAAVREGRDWRVIHTPDRPFIAEWQKRMVLVFFIALLAMLPPAWLFARRLVKPIRAFADAADQVGRDALAPMVAEDGPSELRLAARAVNAMQGRITEQMREREAMVAAIAHDLRTPLSRIAFRIEAADDKLREPIQRDIDQMKAMITATLSFVQGSSQDNPQEAIELGGLLGEIVANEQHVDRPVSWQGSAPKNHITVRGDRIALGRMIQNLVDNAIAYGSQANVALLNGGGQARIIVADRGPGLPADEVEAMFAPFARKERSRNRETGGVGLGLAIARAIARDHGGEIALGPRAGGGMEAVVTLPVVQPGAI